MVFFEFLKQLKEQNKNLLFFVLIVFGIYVENLVVQLNDLNYVQLSPFTGYAMYSGKLNSSQIYYLYDVQIDKTEKLNFNTLTQQNKHIIQQSMLYMHSFRENNFKDRNLVFIQSKLNQFGDEWKHSFDRCLNKSEDFQEYIFWYKRYIERTIGHKVTHLNSRLIRVKYAENSRIVPVDTITLINTSWKN